MNSYGLERRISRKARSALARYEDIRKDRTAMVVQKSHENGKRVPSPALANKDEVAASVTQDWQVRVQERLDWLYVYETSAEI